LIFLLYIQYHNIRFYVGPRWGREDGELRRRSEGWGSGEGNKMGNGRKTRIRRGRDGEREREGMREG
jgi:hypothetical protein